MPWNVSRVTRTQNLLYDACPTYPQGVPRRAHRRSRQRVRKNEPFTPTSKLGVTEGVGRLRFFDLERRARAGSIGHRHCCRFSTCCSVLFNFLVPPPTPGTQPWAAQRHGAGIRYPWDMGGLHSTDKWPGWRGSQITTSWRWARIHAPTSRSS